MSFHYNYNGFCVIDREHWLNFDKCEQCKSFNHCKNAQIDRVVKIKELGFKVPEAYLKDKPYLRGYA